MSVTKKNSSAAPSAGELLESRVAALWYWSGFVARRSVDLRRFFDPDPLQVTDLDLVAFEIGPTLVSRRYIGEVKGGTGKSAPRPLDRAIWLSGLVAFVGADGGELTTALRASDRVRAVARALRIDLQTVEDLTRRERQLGLGDLMDQGPHAPALLSAVHDARRASGSNVRLEQIFRFLRGDGWLIEPWIALRRTIALCQLLAREWTPAVADHETKAVRWLWAEAICLFTLQAVRAAGDTLRLDSPSLIRFVADRLGDGGLTAEQHRRLSAAIDRYVGTTLRRAGVPDHVVVSSIGALDPEPVPYLEPLVETLRRLALDPTASRHLPRFADLVVYERLVREREPLPHAIEAVGLRTDAGMRLLRLLLTFLGGQAGLPRDVVDIVTTEVPGPIKPPQSSGGSSLTLGLPADEAIPAAPEPGTE